MGTEKRDLETGIIDRVNSTARDVFEFTAVLYNDRNIERIVGEDIFGECTLEDIERNFELVTNNNLVVERKEIENGWDKSAALRVIAQPNSFSLPEIINPYLSQGYCIPSANIKYLEGENERTFRWDLDVKTAIELFRETNRISWNILVREHAQGELIDHALTSENMPIQKIYASFENRYKKDGEKFVDRLNLAGDFLEYKINSNGVRKERKIDPDSMGEFFKNLEAIHGSAQTRILDYSPGLNMEGNEFIVDYFGVLIDRGYLPRGFEVIMRDGASIRMELADNATNIEGRVELVDLTDKPGSKILRQWKSDYDNQIDSKSIL